MWRPLWLRGRPMLAMPCLVVAIVACLPVRPAAADPVSHCTATKGVVVVVDFRHFGGAVDRGCGSTPTTGYAALHHAGFSTAGDDQDGPAFVCRINDFPTPAQQSCARTPPTSASWSYWHANPGQSSWSLSQLGAMSSHPQAGSVDAWVYGSTVGGGTVGEPSFSPASVRATGPTPSAAPVHTSRPSAKPHHSIAPSPPTATPTPSPAVTRPTHRHHKHPAKQAAVPPPSATSNGTRITVGLSPDGLPRKSSGSPTGLIVGISLVVVLAGAGGLTAWRRRRQSP
jgi:MYXO-CTERM domain-containing protein